MKERADVLIHKRGLVDSREKAKRIIMEGSVYVDEVRVDKPGEKLEEDANIIIRGNPVKFVSRGGLKLEKAIEVFGFDLENKLAIDIGASTGGFTHCMLKEGARKVFAIDVGYGQLDWQLRQDDRVVVMERTNIRDVELENIGQEVDFISIDVSFISLKLVLPVARDLLKNDGEIMALIKPQFEAGKEKVGKKGIIRDKKVHLEVLETISDFCFENGLKIDRIDYSPIKGSKGNIEFIVKIVKSQDHGTIDYKEIVTRAHEELSQM